MSEAGQAAAATDTAAATAVAAQASSAATKGAETAGTQKPASEAAKVGEDASTKEVATPWPDDWRERLAGDDPQQLSRLRRYASPENYLTRTRGIENQIRTGMLKPVLTDKATEPEIAEYRKAHGIPAEPTIEGYGLKFPDTVQLSDADKADLGAFLGDMHKAHAPAVLVQAAVSSYLAAQEKATQQLHDAAQRLTVDHKAEIRAEMGRDYDRNMSLGNSFISKHLGPEKATALAAMPLSDGTLLGDHPDFVRLYTAAALASADDAALVNADGGTGAGSIEEQYQKALALGDTDLKAYHSKEHQEKLIRLASARAKKAA